MRSSWARAVDSELQDPVSLILPESSEGIGGTNAKACWSFGNFGWEKEDQKYSVSVGSHYWCRKHLPGGMLCRTEARDMLKENLIKTKKRQHDRVFCREVSGCE